jgi:hypothetical protein
MFQNPPLSWENYICDVGKKIQPDFVEEAKA